MRLRRPLRPRTLRGRLTLFYAAVLATVLVAFGATTYVVAMEDEAKEAVHGEAPSAVSHRLLLALGIGLPAALVVAIAGGLFISRRALAPIEGVVRVLGNLDADNLEQRIPSHAGAGAEVETLVGALNSMLARIERSVGGLRRFTADAAHELRTPVTSLMGNLEVTLRRPREPAELRVAMESALEELGRLGRLVESLLVLARSDAGELPLRPVEVDVAQVVEGVLEPYQEIAVTRGIRLLSECSASARADADPLWLGRALANLVDNACKFTPQGGQVAVRVGSSDGRICIQVEDSGPGLLPEERARAFERFYRGDAARGGSDGFGLGLSLARDIAQAMGGALMLTSRDGGGTVARLELPAHAASQIREARVTATS